VSELRLCQIVVMNAPSLHGTVDVKISITKFSFGVQLLLLCK